MNIILNGKPHSAETAITVAELVESLGLAPSQMAIEVGGAIVPKSTWASHTLCAGDVVECVHFIGGG